ncbi:DUF1566 domain-containing protein [Leptospira andrefontaineae]|nr:DUF1566 domain-containing protein [Leptospira andrefontaineae]
MFLLYRNFKNLFAGLFSGKGALRGFGFAPLLLLFVFYTNCGIDPGISRMALFNALRMFLGMPGPNNSSNPPSNPGIVLSPGQGVDLNGNGGSTNGVVVDPSGNGSTQGISITGNGVPQLIIINDADGNPYAVDTNGNGTIDYYLCAHADGSITLSTGLNCSGNQVTIYPGLGYDENGDGVIDNPILAQIAGDAMAPISSITPSPGIYGGAQKVVITCSDNLAPGNIVYTLDNSSPDFSPNGTVVNPPKTSFTVGGFGEGTYTVKFRCRDLAGNLEGEQSATYTVNFNLPNVSMTTSPANNYLSGQTGAISSLTYEWTSNQAGNFSIRRGGTGCGDGSILSSGTVSANITNSLTINASSLSIGSNTIYVCVTAGFTGQTSFSVVRDDTPPIVTPSPGAGNYGKTQSITLGCADLASTDCAGVVYTLDNSSPVVSGITGTITNGISYSSGIPLNNGDNFTVKYVGRDKAGNLSSITSAAYSVNTSTATVSVTSTTPALVYNNLIIDNSSSPQVSWSATGNKAGYSLFLKKSNACTVCLANDTNNCPENYYKDTSGVFYSTAGDCFCSNGTSLIGANTNASGSFSVSDPATVPVISSVDPLNFSLGKNTLLICVNNAAAGYGPQYGSSELIVWKDLQDPQSSTISPAVNAQAVNPNPSKLQISFSEPMSNNVVPILTVEYFNGSTWVAVDITGAWSYSWDTASHNVLTVLFNWVNFPENAYLRWTISQSSLQDLNGNFVQGNDPSGDLRGVFLTTTSKAAAISAAIAAGTSLNYPILKTAQTTCYNVSGNAVYSSCSGVNTTVGSGGTSVPTKGQDAYFGYGTTLNLSSTPFALSSSYPSDVVIKDFVYSLVWKAGIQGKFSFANAWSACSSLNTMNPDGSGAFKGYAGLTNWRLPTINELEYLISYTYSGLNSTQFPDSDSSTMEFWSSTFFAPNLSSGWYATFANGSIYFDAVGSTPRKVRCVSGN